MKRFAIVLLSVVMLFALVGCDFVSDNRGGSKDNPTTVPTTNQPATEQQGCVTHDFTEATLLSPRTCSVCDATDGKPLYKQCKTWEDVVDCLYFGEYTYNLRVEQSEDKCLLFLEFDDASQFTTEESVKKFMTCSLLALEEVSGLARGKRFFTTIDTPSRFRVDVAVSLIVPGGTIVCTPTDNNMWGVYTVLVKDEESTNAALIESAYESTLGSLGITLG